MPNRIFTTLLVCTLLLTACAPVAVTQVVEAPITASSTTSPDLATATDPRVALTSTLSHVSAPTNTSPPAKPPAAVSTPTLPGLAKLTKTAWYRGNSPDLNWLWIVEEPNTPGYDYFITHLVNADGTKEWFIHPEPGTTGWMRAEYLPYFWLPKEPYVYLAGHGCCADGISHYQERSLARLNLETGQLVLLLPWKKDYSVSFSPSGKYMLWSVGGQRSVNIQRLSSGKEVTAVLPVKYYDVGRNINFPQEGWSPEGNRVILETYLNVSEGSDPAGRHAALVIMDAETGGYQLIDNDLTQAIGVNDQWEYQIVWSDNEHVVLTVGDKRATYLVETGG